MTGKRTISVVGAGAWGTALAMQMRRAGHAVRLWARDADMVAAIRRGENPRYLPGVKVDPGIAATTAAAQQAEGTIALEEVVVTARKVEERLQDVPLSIQVLGGQRLEREGVARLEDVARLVPGVTRWGVGEAATGASSSRNSIGCQQPSAPRQKQRLDPEPNRSDRLEILHGTGVHPFPRPHRREPRQEIVDRLLERRIKRCQRNARDGVIDVAQADKTASVTFSNKPESR